MKESTSFKQPSEIMLHLKGSLYLEAFLSRGGYVCFDQKQFIQALLEECLTPIAARKNFEALIPDKWPTLEYPPWLERETAIHAICQRFQILEYGIIPAFREYFNDPRKVPKIINDKLIQSIMYTILVSSSETERGYSQMNLVCSPIRSKLTVLHMSSLLFISINGPPPHLWNADSSVSSCWLLSHRYATDTRSKKAKLASLADLNSIQRMFT